MTRFFQYFTFRNYLKCASFGFGLTFASGVLSSSFDTNGEERLLTIYKTPLMFTSGLFFKSLQYGILFPAIPFKIIQNPREFFILGEGVKNTILENEIIVEKAEPFSETNKKIMVGNAKWGSEGVTLFLLPFFPLFFFLYFLFPSHKNPKQ